MKSKFNLSFGLALFILAIWLWLKWLKFDLGFYFSDIYSHLELSNFWLRGESFLHENRYGDNRALHNYYLNPVLGIFTYWWGAYGLFVAHLGLIALGTWQWLRQSAINNWYYLILFGFFLSPMAYWFWDNRPYGWHVELLYLPLAFLCVQNLNLNKFKTAAIWAIAIVLVREDGILLVWALGTAYLIIVKQKPLISKTNFYFSLACLLLFILGLGLIQHFANGESRLSQALNLDTLSAIEILKNLAYNLGGYLVFVLPFILLICLYYPIRYCFFALLISLPLFFGAWVSGLFYLPDTYHSVIWQPRMIALWSVWIGVLMFLNTTIQHQPKLKNNIPIWLSVAVLWLMQFFTLIVLRDHNLFSMTTDIGRENKIYNEDKRYAVVQKIAQSTPHAAFVVVPYEYFHLFHQHKIIWPDHLEKALGQPDIVVAREEDSSWSGAFDSLYTTVKKEGIILKSIAK